MLSFFILLLVVFFVLMFLLYSPCKEMFDNQNLLFLHEKETLRVLTENRDHYYDTFQEMDKKARKIKSIEEYTNRIQKSVSYFTYEEKERIKQCMESIYHYFEGVHYTWLDGAKLNRIPWKIGIFNGYDYENGLPHTREDVILLCRDRFAKYSEGELARTLIHEKIHIYQKMYPEDTERFKKEYGYKRMNLRMLDKNIRANPDLDPYVYQDKDNKINACYYHPTADTIEDVYYSPQNTQKYEHPHEYMAIWIENNYVP